ncbi:MAG: alpha/beta hydrolase, partial [Proteobacteria bacterium]|nr:alpha/beta hydrolase [Pseudomonadota bacterium]
MATDRNAPSVAVARGRCAAPRAARAALVLALGALAGCAGGPAPLRTAAAQGFRERTLPAGGFPLLVLERAGGGGPRWVFLEGDGRPFVAHGTRVAADPTP